MTDIEIAITILAMLGGLLLANVANNMADALRARRDLPIGFTPWAINIYISAGVISQFASYAVTQDAGELDVLAIAGTVAVLMPYIMVSRLLYPEHKDRWTSVEEYYITNRKLILGITVMAPVIMIFLLARFDFEIPLTDKIALLSVLYGPVIVTLVLLMLTDKRKWHWAGWGFLLVHRIVMMSLVAVSVNAQA